jgi:hypothetical protein
MPSCSYHSSSNIEMHAHVLTETSTVCYPDHPAVYQWNHFEGIICVKRFARIKTPIPMTPNAPSGAGCSCI